MRPVRLVLEAMRPRQRIEKASALRPAVVTGVLIAVALLIAGLQPRERLAGTNARTQAPAVNIPLWPGEEHCHGGEYVPAAADRLRVLAGTPDAQPGEPLLVEVSRRSGQRAFEVRIPGGWAPGDLRAPLPPHPDVELARVCFTNLGDDPMSLTGNFTSLNRASGARINGPDQPDVDLPRLDFLLPGEPSSFAMAGRAAERSALFRPQWQGAWTPWVALLAVLGMGFLALRRLLQDAADRDAR